MLDASLSITELFEMFPDEDAACKWLEGIRWPDGERHCLLCYHSGQVHDVPSGKPMPYRCGKCKQYFSLRADTIMERSPLPIRKWLIAIYLFVEHPKGLSSIVLGRQLGVTQKTAWYLGHRIRRALERDHSVFGMFKGPVEVDETYLGGKEKNKHYGQKLKIKGGSGGKTAVIGIKDRATKQVVAIPVEHVNRVTAEGFIGNTVNEDAMVYTDDSSIYNKLPHHDSVNHSKKEYVRGKVHTNGVESFWSMLKRGYYGTYHWMSPKHMFRYAVEFAERHNIRHLGTLARMEWVAERMIYSELSWKQLVSS